MKIFPVKTLKFKLIDTHENTLNRLIRKTDHSERMTMSTTKKSFRGIVDGSQFKLLSSAMSGGAFCLMTGAIDVDGGYVKVEVNKPFKLLLCLLLAFPIIAVLAILVSTPEKFSPVHLLIMVAQTLMMRYVFIGVAFNLLSRNSLNRLGDVLDLEWIEV